MYLTPINRFNVAFDIKQITQLVKYDYAGLYQFRKYSRYRCIIMILLKSR